MKKYMLFLLVLIAFFSACSSDAVDFSNYQSLNELTIASRTAKGVSVRSYKQQPKEVLDAVDRGLDEVFHIASNEPYNFHLLHNRYTGEIGFTRHNNYRVWLLQPSNRCENPAFIREYKGTAYDQSEYDKDPRVGYVALCAAGGMRHLNNGSTSGGNVFSPGIVIVDSLSVAEAASRFEGEHALLDEVHPILFAQTVYHQTGGHPIIPDPNTGQIRKESLRTVTAVIDDYCFILTK